MAPATRASNDEESVSGRSLKPACYRKRSACGKELRMTDWVEAYSRRGAVNSLESLRQQKDSGKKMQTQRALLIEGPVILLDQ